MTTIRSDFAKDLMLTPGQIKRRFGIDERTLKTMRQSNKANNGDVPKYFMICNRPHYPAADFDIWFQRQKAKSDERAERAKRAIKVKAAK